jgi:hypothetical protein
MKKRILFALIFGVMAAPSALAFDDVRRVPAHCGPGQKSMDCYTDGRAFFCDRQESQKRDAQANRGNGKTVPISREGN